jgi:hypothetical protein
VIRGEPIAGGAEKTPSTPSTVEDSQVELAETRSVGDQVDLGDPPSSDGEADHPE